jgi:predicted transposase/invertase (TIGR01784 family)
MRTDTIFYQLFLTFNSLLFELLGQPPENAIGYQFKSVEVKEKAFRFDGIFIPERQDKLIYFAEIQFQNDPNFYWKFITEINIYLNQYKPIQDWKGVAIFPDRSFDVETLTKYQQEFISSGRIVQIYLDEISTESIGMGLIRLIIIQKNQAPELVEQIKQRTKSEILDPNVRQKIIELLGTVLTSKFSNLTRQEIQEMFLLDDIKQSRLYQDLKEDVREDVRKEVREDVRKEVREDVRKEVREDVRKEESKMLLLKQLSKRFVKLSNICIQDINNLALEQLEELAEAWLDFENISDLDSWLEAARESLDISKT